MNSCRPTWRAERSTAHVCLSVSVPPASSILSWLAGAALPPGAHHQIYICSIFTRENLFFYVPCFLFALSRRPSVRIVQPSLMLSNLLTFSFHTISSLSLSSLSSLTSFSFFLLHPVVTPVQAGSLSLLSLCRCHKRHKDLNLINDQRESERPTFSIKSWSTLHMFVCAGT